MKGESDLRNPDDTRKIAHQMRSTLAVIRTRIQLMRRRQERGGVAYSASAADFATVDAAIVRLVAMIDRIDC